MKIVTSESKVDLVYYCDSISSLYAFILQILLKSAFWSAAQSDLSKGTTAVQ